jgi:hypothetical protein
MEMITTNEIKVIAKIERICIKAKEEYITINNFNNT